jgi:hypothetical protein
LAGRTPPSLSDEAERADSDSHASSTESLLSDPDPDSELPCCALLPTPRPASQPIGWGRELERRTLDPGLVVADNVLVMQPRQRRHLDHSASVSIMLKPKRRWQADLAKDLAVQRLVSRIDLDEFDGVLLAVQPVACLHRVRNNYPSRSHLGSQHSEREPSHTP